MLTKFHNSVYKLKKTPKTPNIVFYSADLCFTIISLCASPWLNPFSDHLLECTSDHICLGSKISRCLLEIFWGIPTLLYETDQLVMRAGSLASITRKPASVRHWRWHIMLETWDCAAWIYSLGSKSLFITSSILLPVLLTNIAHPQNYV